MSQQSMKSRSIDIDIETDTQSRHPVFSKAFSDINKGEIYTLFTPLPYCEMIFHDMMVITVTIIVIPNEVMVQSY